MQAVTASAVAPCLVTRTRAFTSKAVLPRLQRSRGVVVQAGFLENAVNGLSTFINNSPLNEGKKQLAIKQAGDYDAQATRAKIEKLTSDNAVLVFSWLSCPYCKKAKALLSELGAKFEAIELEQGTQEGAAIRAELGQLTNRTSMPSCWIGGKCYGGCNDGPGIMVLHREGKLVPLLKEAGAL